MNSIDSFIKGDNLCQALECCQNILGKNIMKTLNQESKATGSNNRPFSSSFSFCFSNNFYASEKKFFTTPSGTNNSNVESRLKGDRPFSSKDIKVRLIDI